MYQAASRNDPRPGDLWWLPASWWPALGPLVTRPFFAEGDPERQGPPLVQGRRYSAVEDSFQSPEGETIVIRAKRVPCLIISPYRDMVDGRVKDFVVLRTKDYPSDQNLRLQIERASVPHAFPLEAAQAPYGLNERWVDFTSQDSFPKTYLKQTRWRPICRMIPDYYEKLVKHYSAWFTRDQEPRR